MKKEAIFFSDILWIYLLMKQNTRKNNLNKIKQVIIGLEKVLTHRPKKGANITFNN